jgi:glycosyltransferase involved in cell wall biosynthesis
LRIALVHDYLTQYGGAERVLEQLKLLYPDAPIFTSFVDFDRLPRHIRNWEIHPSAIANAPGAVNIHRALLPIYPFIFRNHRRALREFDVLIADSSAWSHHAGGRCDSTHLCYCHTPARFLYQDRQYLDLAHVPAPAKMLLPPVLRGLRAMDQRAATKVDRYVANSATVAGRIKFAYGREARVVFPPVDLERFSMNPNRADLATWYLVVSRTVPHKRVDLVIDACTRASVPLKVIGDGRSLARLKERAGPTVELLGWQPDEVVVDYVQRCRAFILPGIEDFGITAVEAQAAGRPVIAYAGGGTLETVIEGETGVFFREQSIDSLLDAIARAEGTAWREERLVRNAAKFGPDRFRREIAEEVELAIFEKRGKRN